MQCAPASPRLIRRRSLDVIDDDEVALRLGWFELEPQLLFERDEDGLTPRDICLGLRPRGKPLAAQAGRVLVDGKLQNEVEAIGDTGLVEHLHTTETRPQKPGDTDNAGPASDEHEVRAIGRAKQTAGGLLSAAHFG